MNTKEAKQRGLRVLAGPFDSDSRCDLGLAESVETYIKVTGGRTARVELIGDPASFYLYRPSLEMETLIETARRLRLAKLRN